MSPDAHSPAERADAVLRAAEAAAAAAQAASLVAPPVPEAQEARPAAPSDAGPPHAHEAGAPARLLAAAGELDAGVGRARAQLDALEDALARVGRSAAQPE